MDDTKEKHAFTPGPWHLSSIDGVEDSLMVGGGDDGSDIVADIRDEKDARLIAAAPDLLAQCKEFEKCLTYYHGTNENTAISALANENRDKLREVLAKVEGGEG
jgi:hypothetical protein